MVVKRINQEAPRIHDLVRLAELARIEFSEEKFVNLKTITTFNIAGRYDEEKYDFHKKCTKAFAKKYLSISQSLIIWLKKEYHKK